MLFSSVDFLIQLHGVNLSCISNVDPALCYLDLKPSVVGNVSNEVIDLDGELRQSHTELDDVDDFVLVDYPVLCQYQLSWLQGRG